MPGESRPKCIVVEEPRLSIRDFWETVPFLGTPIEQFALRHWAAVLVVPYSLLLAWGFWLGCLRLIPPSVSSLTAVVRDPYVSSLGIALLLSTFAFKQWEKTMRRTFSEALESGIVADNLETIEVFLASSHDFRRRLRGRRRYIASASTLSSCDDRTPRITLSLQQTHYARAGHGNRSA
jgi:hypothetical protein